MLLKTVGKEGDVTARAQESAMSLHRLSLYFANAARERKDDPRILGRIEAANHDILSLMESMRFLSARTAFLLDATLGMISTEQNQIIKLFSVMAVMLMPPTLVASIYGMNFHLCLSSTKVGIPRGACPDVLFRPHPVSLLQAKRLALILRDKRKEERRRGRDGERRQYPDAHHEQQQRGERTQRQGCEIDAGNLLAPPGVTAPAAISKRDRKRTCSANHSDRLKITPTTAA